MFDRVKDIILSIINVADYSERGLRREVFAFLTSFNAVSHNLSCSDPSRFCALWNRTRANASRALACPPEVMRKTFPLFSMQHSAGTKGDGCTKAFNSILNMDHSGRVGP